MLKREHTFRDDFRRTHTIFVSFSVIILNFLDSLNLKNDVSVSVAFIPSHNTVYFYFILLFTQVFRTHLRFTSDLCTTLPLTLISNNPLFPNILKLFLFFHLFIKLSLANIKKKKLRQYLFTPYSFFTLMINKSVQNAQSFFVEV